MPLDTKTVKMLGDIAVCINEDAEDMITAYKLMRKLGRIDYKAIKELQDSGIPIIEELSSLLGVKKVEMLATSKFIGIQFDYIDAVFRNLTCPGAIFHITEA